MLEGDTSKSRELLKEAYGMNPENPVVSADFKAIEDVYSKGGEIPSNNVWIVFENGISAQKNKWEMNLPLFVGQASNANILQQIGKVGMLTMALPELDEGVKAQDSLSVFSVDGVKIGQTASYASMDAVIANEFKKRFPGIVARAVTSSITKGLIQYVASERGGIWGTVAGSVYATATNDADTRMWEGLPSSFDLARIERPECGGLLIKDANGNNIGQVEGLSEGNHVIFIRQTTPNATPAMHIVSFDEENV